jgi:hypothetical protein
VAYYPVYAACPSPCVSYCGPPAISCGIPSSGCGSCAPAVTAAAPSSPYPLVPSTTATPPIEATPSPPPRTFESPTPITMNHAESVPETTEQKGVYERNPHPEGPILPDNSHNTPADGNQVRPIAQPDAKFNSPPARSPSASGDRLTDNRRPTWIQQVAAKPIARSQDAGGWLPGP